MGSPRGGRSGNRGYTLETIRQEHPIGGIVVAGGDLWVTLD
jgi:hypothetical protein